MSITLTQLLLSESNFEHERKWLEQWGVLPSHVPQVAEFDRSPAVIVGNGAFPTAHGSKIDAYETVVRFNGYKTKGFESLVGSKTTIHVLNSQNLRLAREPGADHVHLLIDTCTPGKMFEFYFANCARVKGLQIIRPSLYQTMGRLLKGRYKTQGFFFIEVARQYFSAVAIAGFCGHAHYFNSRWAMYSAHPLDAEHQQYAEWESETFTNLR